MTILDAITLANSNAGIRTLSFANIQEFQAFMDSFTFLEYPINVIVPFTVNGVTNMQTGIRKATLPLQGWVLTRHQEDPNTYRTALVEEKYIGPMRKLAAKFIKEFLKTDIIDPEVSSVRDSIKAEYMFLNALTIGVSYTLDAPIKQNVC